MQHRPTSPPATQLTHNSLLRVRPSPRSDGAPSDKSCPIGTGVHGRSAPASGLLLGDVGIVRCRHDDLLPLAHGRRPVVIPSFHRSPAHQAVYFCQNGLKRLLDVRGVEGRGLDEGQVALLCIRLRIVCWHGAQVPQIALVAHQHDDDVVVSMVPELLQPAVHVLEGDVLGDVVDEKRADRSPVIGAGDRPVPLLPSCVPDLRLDGLTVHLDAAGCKLHPDGALGLQVELVAREPGQQVGLADARVSDQHHFKQIVILVVLAASAATHREAL
mmetsp:Transcript_60445/g.148696  ORF Transcript_60445/g.148696 Transcript_60445/m.148696 type:complete len:272 (-) Transcript_60445:163-978(-)